MSRERTLVISSKNSESFDYLGLINKIEDLDVSTFVQTEGYLRIPEKLVQYDDEHILVFRDNGGLASIAQKPILCKLNLSNGSVEELDQSMFSENFIPETVEKFNNGSFLVIGMSSTDNGFRIDAYLLNSDLSLHEQFGENGMMNLSVIEDDYIRLSTYSFEKYVYVSINHGDGNQLIRFSNLGSNTLNSETKRIECYPNPTAGILNIKQEIRDSPTFYEIRNSHGYIVTKGLMKSQNLDCSTLESGYYLLTLSKEESVYQESFIKE